MAGIARCRECGKWPVWVGGVGRFWRCPSADCWDGPRNDEDGAKWNSLMRAPAVRKSGGMQTALALLLGYAIGLIAASMIMAPLIETASGLARHDTAQKAPDLDIIFDDTPKVFAWVGTSESAPNAATLYIEGKEILSVPCLSVVPPWLCWQEFGNVWDFKEVK